MLSCFFPRPQEGEEARVVNSVLTDAGQRRLQFRHSHDASGEGEVALPGSRAHGGRGASAVLDYRLARKTLLQTRFT